ncbi:MAG: Wzz/FepE/Etk N-terminal domain-containing protein, partial [Actinomycetota bacterium]
PVNREEGPEPLEIAKYVHVIKRRAWLVALVALFVAICVVGLSAFQGDSYTAETEILVTTLPSEEVSDIPTQAELIRSSAVSHRVQESLGLQEPPEDLGELIVEPMLESQVIAVSYTTSSASSARDVVNEFAAQYLSFRRKLARESIRAVRQQFERAKTNLADLSAEMATTPPRSARGRSLRAQQKVILARTRLLQKKLVDL